MTSHHNAPQLSSSTLLGKVVFSRYLLEAKVGQGGMAWVFQAWDVDDDKPVAAKILLPHIAEDQALAQRFLREAKIQGSLHHPHIVELLDTCQHSGLTSIIMEWVEGESFHDMLQRTQQPVKGNDLLHLMMPVLEGMEYAHTNNMVHRDLKLENLLIHWDKGFPVPKIADFGLAKILDDMEENQTKTDMVMGTLRYMAPEQVNSMKNAGPAADIYSLGICLYILASGHPPFRGSTQELVVSILNTEPPDPRKFNPAISLPLADVILRSIAKDPADRFASCAEFSNALREALIPKAALAQTLPAMEPFQPEAAEDTAAAIGLGETLDASLTSLLPPEPGTINIAVRPDPETITRAFQGESMPTTVDTHSVSSAKAMSRLALVLFVVLLLVTGLLVYRWMTPQPPPPDNSNQHPTVQTSCKEGSVRVCYTGPENTKNKGNCKVGLQTCRNNQYGPCKGERTPQEELCNGKDDNCDGTIDEPFAKKGKSCTIRQGDCSRSGTWACGPKADVLVCQRSQEASPLSARQLVLDLHPKGQTFQLSYQKKKRSLANQHCVVLPKRRTLRLTVKAPGFYRCRVTLRPRKQKRITLTLRRKKRYGLEPSASYCQKRRR
ncbi:MAG: serine/threonine protein kinase [Deltaproteobacteria bacterium]|nr:MAG: serine/threonine protein kinase [Deltaproteobacteria bacterium]